MLSLELLRALIAQRAVKTLVIVVDFDILEQFTTRNRLGLKDLIGWQTSVFKRTKERFGLCVIIAVSLRAHT
jgi:hypothetical protein